MNQRWWLWVEHWERGVVSKYGKASGSSGPVFADSDPLLSDVDQSVARLRARQNCRVPRRFWKVVTIRGPQDEFRSAAFVLDQDSLWKSRPSSGDPFQFLATVESIEKLIGLDFGESVRAPL